MPPAAPTIPQIGLRLRDAVRRYGPPEIVAELSGLLDALRHLQGWNLSRAKADLEADAEKLMRRLWEYLKRRLVADDGLILSWQPPDPTADRQRLSAGRCSGLHVRITSDDIEDRVFLDGYALSHVLIHPAKAVAPKRSDVAEAGQATAEIGVSGEPALGDAVPRTPAEALQRYLERSDVPRGQKARFDHYRKLNQERIASGAQKWPYLSRPAFATGRKRGNPGRQQLT